MDCVCWLVGFEWVCVGEIWCLFGFCLFWCLEMWFGYWFVGGWWLFCLGLGFVMMFVWVCFVLVLRVCDLVFDNVVFDCEVGVVLFVVCGCLVFSGLRVCDLIFWIL